MNSQYSVELCRRLEEEFHALQLYRPMRIARYDRGTELSYHITAIENKSEADVRLVIENFVGGGFAGQVYKVKISEINSDNGSIAGLEVGGTYAMKILIPPSGFAKLFRNLLYWIGFQGPFQLQVNPAAARAGALWQKFIRRAAKIRFGNENAVANIHATFVDSKLGSCGELSEWVDGRTWRLEVDDHLDLLKLHKRGRPIPKEKLGSDEYRAKKQFMADFVKLLHEIGAYEFARQYEWSTCKSQPNCLKRKEFEDNPTGGLVAVDFRAGLALLPFLPMSPGDFKLIWQGLKRGSLVQFDRGSIKKLETFISAHREHFSDAKPMLEELKSTEQTYRNSVPDITHNHIRLLYSGKLWKSIFDSAVTGWKIRDLIDEQNEQKLRTNKISTFLFFLLGLIPFLGKVLRRLWARPDWRTHYLAMLTSFKYFTRAIRGKIAEKLIIWYRAGRVSSERAHRLAIQPWRFFCHLPFSILPFAGLHRILTDWDYAKERLAYFFVRPIRLYFNAELREQWLRDMVTQGQKKHMLSKEDAENILSHINEPYIQKYLISLVVHLLTLPVTQIVSITIAGIYVLTHWGQPNAFKIGLGIIAIFQFIPISPGSICRGLYVLYLVVKEKDFRDYNIAVFLAFFKYIGYLAFPIQMTYHYPALARFMASHWATEAVHIVPVFGERGALLEHWVFCLFYNWPLTIRRRMRKRMKMRKSIKPRYWHVPLCATAAAAIFGLVDFIYIQKTGQLPTLWGLWWLLLLVNLACGTAVTLRASGAALWKRFVSATICGITAGLIYTLITLILSDKFDIDGFNAVKSCAWRVFDFALLSTIAAILTELKLPDPDLKR